jgi:CDP-diglyceride synthetase
VLARWGIRLLSSLIGIAAGLLLASALLSGLSMTVTAVVEATIVFWIVHLIVQFLALRILIRQPSVAMVGLLALASTVVSLFVVNLIVPGLTIRGTTTYLWATLIVWVTTSIGDFIGTRKIRERRRGGG